MKKTNCMAAEVVFKKAQMLEADANKACYLVLCLIRQSCFEEASLILEDVLHGKIAGSDDVRSRKRAEELLAELNSFFF